MEVLTEDVIGTLQLLLTNANMLSKIRPWQDPFTSVKIHYSEIYYSTLCSMSCWQYLKPLIKRRDGLVVQPGKKEVNRSVGGRTCENTKDGFQLNKYPRSCLTACQPAACMSTELIHTMYVIRYTLQAARKYVGSECELTLSRVTLTDVISINVMGSVVAYWKRQSLLGWGGVRLVTTATVGTDLMTLKTCITRRR